MLRILHFARNRKDAATKETVPSSETPAQTAKDDAEAEAAMIGRYLRLADIALGPSNGDDNDAQDEEAA